MKNYQIRSGKMLLDLKPVPLEFGNLEQIKIIKQEAERNRLMKEEGLKIHPSYEIQFRFLCLCGYSVYHEEDIEEFDDVSEFIPQKDKTCSQCKREYVFDLDDSGDYVVKLKN